MNHLLVKLSPSLWLYPGGIRDGLDSEPALQPRGEWRLLVAMSVVQGRPQRQVPGGMGGEGVEKRDQNAMGSWGRLGVGVRGTRFGHGVGDLGTILITRHVVLIL